MATGVSKMLSVNGKTKRAIAEEAIQELNPDALFMDAASAESARI